MSEPTPTTCPRCGGKGYTMRGIADPMRCRACNGTGRVSPAPTAEPTPEQRAGHLWERLLAIIEDPDLVTMQATTDAALAAIREAEAAAFARGRAEGLREAEQKCQSAAQVVGDGDYECAVRATARALAAAVAALAVPPDDRGGE